MAVGVGVGKTGEKSKWKFDGFIQRDGVGGESRWKRGKS